MPITVVAAPPGYGKTTLLAEWSQRHPSRFAWLSLDRHDNDLGRMVSYTAAALERIEPIDPELLRPTVGGRSVAAVASRVAGAISAMKEPVLLVLDHVESLHNDDCRDTIAEVALHLPAGSRLALATRADPPLPMARLRVGGDVVEVGVDELAMKAPEARRLLDGAGVQLNEVELDRLLERTEGWPVGLYLAALALQAGGSQRARGASLLGRRPADGGLPAVRAAVAPLAGRGRLPHANGHPRSAERAAVRCGARHAPARAHCWSRSHTRTCCSSPSTGPAEWYRYHHLFRDLLRAELQRREPELVHALHVRAAEWYEVNHMPYLAIDHAQAGGDVERVNRLILMNGQRAFATGQGETARRWLTWFEEENLVEQYPAVAVLGALFYISTGEPTAAERWTDAAEHPSPAVLPDGSPGAQRTSPERILPDGSTLASWRALLRSQQTRNGLDAMRRDAEPRSKG